MGAQTQVEQVGVADFLLERPPGAGGMPHPQGSVSQETEPLVAGDVSRGAFRQPVPAGV